MPPRAAVYPDFICIGAQKAGTTWLYRNLQRHPGVWLPPEKELHYFDEKRGRPHPWRSRLFGERTEDVRWRRHLRRRARAARRGAIGELRWGARYLFGTRSDAWYASLFEPGRGRRTGEVTPAYSMLDVAEVAEVARLIPDLRVIFLMRNPIERAWSHAMMDTRIIDPAIAASVTALDSHFTGDGSRLRTDYARTLDAWAAAFAPARIFVGFVEDIAFHPQELIDRIYDFLGLERVAAAGAVGERVHEGGDAGIPIAAACRLAELHHGLTVELDRRFGGYAAWWRFCAERLLDGGVVEDWLPTPIYGGSLWRTWEASAGSAPIQSDTLERLSRARMVGAG